MIRILKKGLHTSIQDLGRKGYRNYGIPISGAMDSNSAILSNIILGNKEVDAVMEITFQGPEIQFLSATRIAITGAIYSPTKNKKPLEMNKSISIQKGDIINFGAPKSGVRSYLAISGGFQTELVYGSRSYYEGVTKKGIIENKDEIPFNSSFKVGLSQYDVHKLCYSSISNSQTLKVDKGPEFELLNKNQQHDLLSNTFSLGINNRMAYQIQELIPNQLKSIISSAVLPGTVQLTPSGKMILLMRDCQTTGGYPRILQLTEQSINFLAQKIQHEKVNFELTPLSD
ncbi:MAG: biotin-dependent carboxyltransferase family protein [Cyclobacteriaceae bacterium]|nr:biotin-dependent carboxyltransferase family protein [Cyclobacteriaceae bacterium]